MKYKMVCIDMDGTMLGSTKKISKRTLHVIKKCSEKGVKIVVTTGRLFSNASYYSNLIGVNTPVISANGAEVREHIKEEVIYKSPLSCKSCEKLLKLIKKYNIIAHFHTSDTIIANSYISYLAGKRVMGWVEHPKYKTKLELKLKKSECLKMIRDYEGQILKCILFSFNNKKLGRFREEVEKIPELVAFVGGRRSLEINSVGVSKGNAVKVLAQKYNIKMEEIICIGDNENDISMIEVAGIGVAMKNGIDQLKEKAQYITDTNDNDGVAKALEKYILN
ncbi:MAG: Cof-type HAD-IIB family hydrolase [Clostridium sp.]